MKPGRTLHFAILCATLVVAVLVAGCGPLHEYMSKEALEVVVAREFHSGDLCRDVDARLVSMDVTRLKRTWKSWPPPAESTLHANLGRGGFLFSMWSTDIYFHFDPEEKLVRTEVVKSSGSAFP